MDQERAEGRDANGPARPASPLGRGLEDVSHLFLSATPPSPPGAPVPSPGAPATPQTESAGGNGHEALRLVQSCPPPDRQQLVSFLTAHLEALEAGLRAIDASLACEGCGEIDLLAADGDNRLAVVDVDTGADEGLLPRALAHCDWLARNVTSLRRMYTTGTLDLTLRPRIFLVAPRLSWMVRCAARQINAPRITCCTYRAVALPGLVGILVDSDRTGA